MNVLHGDAAAHRGRIRAKRRKIIRMRLLLAGIICCLLLVVTGDVGNWLEASLQFIRRQGGAADYLFVVLYVATCIFLLPGFILTVSAAPLFGLAKGILLVSIGVTVGGACAFLIGRYFARDWVRRRVAADPRLRKLDQSVGREGWKIVLLARLTPMIPFRFSSYAFGVTRIPFKQFFLANWLGTLPSCTFYVYSGSVIGELAKQDFGEYFRRYWWSYAIGILLLLVWLAFVRRVVRNTVDGGTKQSN